MGSSQTTVDYLLTQLKHAGVVSSRKMFGEHALYCNTKVVALVCDDQLFIKPTAAGEKFLGIPEMGEPYPGARPYFLITEDNWDDADWLSELIKLTAAELPLPKPKKKSHDSKHS